MYKEVGNVEFEHMACSLLKVSFSPNPLISREMFQIARFPAGAQAYRIRVSVGRNWESELLMAYPAHEFQSGPQFELHFIFIVKRSCGGEFYCMQSRNGIFLFF